MKRQLFIMVLLAIAGTIFAQNSLVVEDLTVPQNGGYIKLKLTLDEANVYTAYSFKIETPVGIGYVTDSQGDVTCILGEGHDSSHGATVHWNENTRLLIAAVTSTGKLLKGQTVVLQIPIAATTANIGATFNFKIVDLTFIKELGTKVYLNDVPFTVTIGAPADNRTILDETFTTAPASATNVDVRVRRKIKADEWSTICLPFAMDETQVKAAFGDDVQLAEFKGWAATDWDANDNTTAIDVTFANATAITANKPYIIKVSQAINEFTADGVDIAPEDEPTVSVGKVNRGTFGSFTGSYVPITIDEECLFLSDNQFWYSTGKTKMKAYRAYFYFQDVLVSYSSGSNAKIGYTINDDVDGIGNLTHMPVDNDSWYTLEGMKLGTKPTKPGVYLHGGKKVIVK